MKHKAISFGRWSVIFGLSAGLLWTTLSTAWAQGGRRQPVSVSISERVVYIPKETVPGTVKDAELAAKGGVVRTLQIGVTNITSSDITVDVEYAIFKIDTKGKVEPMKLGETKNERGQPVPIKKLRETLSLRPGETKHVRGTGTMVGGELAQTTKVAKDLGIVVESGWNYWSSNPWYVTATYNTYDPNRITDAPTPASDRPRVTHPGPPTERYYGYSVVVYAGGDIVFRGEKNPLNVKEFGVLNIK